MPTTASNGTTTRPAHTTHRLSDHCSTAIRENVLCDHMRGDHDKRGCRKCECGRMTYPGCPGCVA